MDAVLVLSSLFWSTMRASLCEGFIGGCSVSELHNICMYIRMYVFHT